MAARRLHLAITATFLVTVGGVGAVDLVQGEERGFDWRQSCAALWGTPDPAPDVFSSFLPPLPAGAAFEDLERQLELASPVRSWARPNVQEILTNTLGIGNAKVVVHSSEEQRWLFHRPSIEFVVGDPIERAPLELLTGWAEELQSRGVELLVLPVPAKVSACPQALGADLEVVHNAGWQELLDGLRAGGVSVIDPTPVLEGAYLRTDSHWTPAGMEAVAELVACALQELGIRRRPPRSEGDRGETLEIERVGDLGRQLDERPEAQWLAPDTVEIRAIGAPEAPWEPDVRSPVLLLGDSFTNIYSLGSMGWGVGAGLAEHLSARLGFDVDCLARNGDGARASREALRLAGAERLEGKEVIVFQFAARELCYGDWTD